MQFNTWESGNNVNDGINKIVRHITLNNPDVVTLQEITSIERAESIRHALGHKWNMFYPYPSKVATFTQHEIYNDSNTKLFCGHGVKIFIDEVNPIVVFNLQFDQKPFSPEEIASNGFDEDIIELFEKNKKKHHSRYQNLKELLTNEFFNESLQKVNVAPVIVAGDLHTPSHLDWTDRAKHFHSNIVYEWPITSILTQQTALLDTYRYIHPSEVEEQGITWSTVEMYIDGSNNKIREPQERIDYIFSRGKSLVPIESYTYPKSFTENTLPYVGNNDWPSDHFAVITVFEWK